MEETDVFLRSLGYNVLRNIGKGAYGKVKLARSKWHSDLVAIKLIEDRGQSDEFIARSLQMELAILGIVRHPHIVQMHDIVFLPNNQVGIVMEAAQTDLLKKIYELSRIPIHQAREWFSQLLSALVYLHQEDIVHRDLKPGNVLLTESDEVKLTDFGFGRFSKGYPEQSHTNCGTSYFMAPEMLLGLPYDPKKSDVWSLGVLLYCMVTGRLPFEASRNRDLLYLQRKPLRYPFWIRVEKPCRDIISFMLQLDPQKRPSMEQVAQHPWLQTRQESCTTSESSSESLRRPGRRAGPFRGLVNFLQKLRKKSGQEKASRETQPSSGGSSIPRPAGTRAPGRNAERSMELESYRSARSRQTDGTSPSTSGDGQAMFSARESWDEPEDDGSSAEEEEPGFCGCGPLCAAVRRAADVHVVAPILRASRSLRESLKRRFRSKVHSISSRQSAHHSAVCAEAPAPSTSEQVCGPEEAPVAVVEQKARRSRKFPTFKILKNHRKVFPAASN